MPINYHTTLANKSKSSFLPLIIFAGPFLIWIEGMPYLEWQKLLHRLCNAWETKSPIKPILRTKKCVCEYSKLNVVTKKHINLDNFPISEGVSNENVKVELITMLKQFWERRHVPQCIEETIPDRRNKEFITYSKQSIMMAALAIFLFRMGSGNKYDVQSHDVDEKYAKTNIAMFINAPEDRAPVIKTIEKFLRNLEENSINSLMIAFFKELQKSKFFLQHPQIKPGDFFLLTADCVHTHTYDHPHHVDVNGNNDCNCCLKRVYNKGTEKESIKWLHQTLVLCFVFVGGLKIPIYRYPIHAKDHVSIGKGYRCLLLEFLNFSVFLRLLKSVVICLRQFLPKNS